MGLHTVCQTHANVVKEVTPQKHTYVCSEERTNCYTLRESSSDLCTVKRAAGAGLLTSGQQLKQAKLLVPVIIFQSSSPVQCLPTPKVYKTCV